MNSAHDIIERNITPVYLDGIRERHGTTQGIRDYFRNFPDPVYQEIANRLEFPTGQQGNTNKVELWDRINSPDPNNRTAVLKTTDGGPKYWYNYHFSDEIVEMEPLYFEIHIINKKWPLKKVLAKHPYFLLVIIKILNFRNIT